MSKTPKELESTTGDNRYLWDRSGPVDPDVERLEQTLGVLRYRKRPQGSFLSWRRLALAAVVTLAAGTTWLLVRPQTPAFDVRSVTGDTTLDPRLEVGGWLETGATDVVEVRVADIGLVTVHPNSRLKLVASRTAAEHRLALNRGRIEAFITAPPRLFFVDTPSAVAVDLGCAYELEVDETGDGLIDVTLGSVALEREDGFPVTVPAGARCRLHAGRGPGLPWYGDADKPFRDAIVAFETETGRTSAVDKIIAQARTRDVLTLFHLLRRVGDEQRLAVIGRMVALAGMPPGVTPEGIQELDPEMLDRWWANLG